jgi:hypothetical protein
MQSVGAHCGKSARWVLRVRGGDAQERAALGYPWKGVFDALEAVGGSDVKVVSFSHDRATRRSRLVLEGPSFNAIDAAVTRIKKTSGSATVWSIESVDSDASKTAGLVRATLGGAW